MLNNELKRQAFELLEKTGKKYEASCKKIGPACNALYEERKKSVKVINLYAEIINSIANTPSYACYRNYPTAGDEKTPVAKHIAQRVLTLPLYADLDMDDVDKICSIIMR